MNGYRVGMSNQIPANLAKGNKINLSPLIFGNWDSLVEAFWSGVDVLVDPYTGGTSGTVRVVLLQDCDIAVRYAASFAVVPDVQTAISADAGS